MLQRLVFVQKRHLEWTFARCKRLACTSPLFHHGRRPFASVQHALRSPSPPDPAKRLAENSSPPTPDKLASWTATSTPFPEFKYVMDALSSNGSFEDALQSVKTSPPLLALFVDRKKMRDVAVNLAQSPNPKQCIDILDLAHSVGQTLKPGAYEAVAFTLASLQHWNLVLIAASAGLQHLKKPTARLLNWRARALIEMQQYSTLPSILDEFDTAKLTPTERTYHIIISGCMRNHDMEGAKLCIQRMTDAGLPLNDRGHILIAGFYRHFGVDLRVRQKALDSLSKLSPKMAVIVLNGVLRSALDMQDIRSTMRLLTLFEPTSVQEITSLLSTTHGQGQGPLQYEIQLPILPKKNLHPDTHTFTLFMNHQIRSSNFQRAIDLGRVALTKGLPATADILTSFIHAFFLQDRGDIAIEMVTRLDTGSMAKQFASLKTYMSPQIDAEVFPRLPDVKLNTRICNALLRGILRRQGLRHVPTIFAIMHANNLQPNARTLEILISYMSSTEGVRPRTILTVMHQLSSSSFEVSIRHMHHLLRYILREEKRAVYGSGWRAYEKKYRNVRRKPITRFLANDYPFDPMGGLGFGSHAGYDAAALPTLQALASRNVMSDPAMISMRIRRDALIHGEFESAQDVIRTLAARGMRPNRYHFSALMEGYAMIGDVDSAREVMKLALDAGIPPSPVMYTILIHGYSRKHDSDAALRAFREMVKLEVYPDVASIDAVVGAFFAAGARKLARQHLVMLWPYIEPFPDALQTASLATLITEFRALDTSRSKSRKTSKSKASVYHQVRRLLYAYRRYFGGSLPNDDCGRVVQKAS